MNGSRYPASGLPAASTSRATARPALQDGPLAGLLEHVVLARPEHDERPRAGQDRELVGAIRTRLGAALEGTRLVLLGRLPLPDEAEHGPGDGPARALLHDLAA